MTPQISCFTLPSGRPEPDFSSFLYNSGRGCQVCKALGKLPSPVTHIPSFPKEKEGWVGAHQTTGRMSSDDCVAFSQVGVVKKSKYARHSPAPLSTAGMVNLRPFQGCWTPAPSIPHHWSCWLMGLGSLKRSGGPEGSYLHYP